jgi:hypothetical protein
MTTPVTTTKIFSTNLGSGLVMIQRMDTLIMSVRPMLGAMVFSGMVETSTLESTTSMWQVDMAGKASV